MSAEQKAVSQGRGKWSQPGVPHKGWSCVGEYDVYVVHGEGETITCGMCEAMQVRFVQIMEHELHPEQLGCGRVCAGNMSGDLAGARLRDGALRSRASRRDKFTERKRWKASAKGTPYIKAEGFYLMVVRRGDGSYGVGATPPGAAKPTWGTRRYRSVDDAQKGCFDTLQVLRSER